MNRTSLRLAAVVAGLAITTAACGSNDDSNTASDTKATTGTTAAATGAAATKTAAAELRAGLTYLLTEHVYLAGIATGTAISKGGNLKDPAVVGAVNALDANSVALSKAVGSAYPAAEKPFLDSWRQHIGFFVNYTLGKATKDTAMVEKAKKDLDGYRTNFGQLINSVVPELPADAVADELKPHVASLFAAIDAQVAGSPTQFDLLEKAAGHMPMTAKILAGGIAANKKLAGKTDDAASELRSGLTYLLTEHVYYAGIAINQAVADKGDLKAPKTAAAVGALDANSVALSKAVGSAYAAAEKPFLDSWRQHIGFFVNYTLGKATKDAAMVSKAKTDLDGYRTNFGQLINSVVPELPADAVAMELTPHVASLFTAIDDVVAGSANTFKDLSTAAGHMPGTAATLAGGIAQNKKLD
jgi:3-keto-L-gulonate-6-phosphate decarboxylase